ncbi:hypothetical protein PV327_011248 [Microctonus hyperodae]|uniref:Uncharacterized protein n=1 Tax=Microctonus hyperodae TaxID=165561 RepID=A0AA39C528_MICHY|nr:hypothetical protein PV327_011248 [Microctonus hyperodae]
MDGSVENLSNKSIRLQFTRWVTKWCHNLHTADRNLDKPDITSLLWLLQSIGFQIRHFEKSENENIDPNNGDNASVKIQIECTTSKIRASLELNDVKCQCPTSQDSDEASFWSVSGTAPTGSMDSINRYEEAGSTLLPCLNKDTQLIIHDIIHSLLKIIKSESQEHQSINISKKIKHKAIEIPEAFTRCYTQPEMSSPTQRKIKNDNINNLDFSNINNFDRRSSNIYHISSMMNPKIPSITTTPPTAAVQLPKESVPSLLRQDTWDMELKKIENEPRPLLPQNKYLPNISTELNTSLGQVSLQSDDSTYTLTECLKRARFYIEKAQKLQANKQSQKPLNLSINKPKNSDSINETTTSSKLLRTRNSICASLSSAVKSNSQKRVIRRSTSGIVEKCADNTDFVPIKSLKLSATSIIKTTPPKTMSTNLTVKCETIGESSQAFASDVAGAQPKIRPLSSSLSVNPTSKRRVSAGTRELNLRSPSSKGDVSQIKTSIIRRSTSGGSSSMANALTLKPATVSILKSELDSNIKKPTSNLSKFVFTKK